MFSGRTLLHSLRKNSALRLCFEGARLLRLCFEGARLQPRRKRRKINGGFSRWGNYGAHQELFAAYSGMPSATLPKLSS
jgi:hypothetical protein